MEFRYSGIQLLGAVALVLAACDRGPPDIVETLDGTTDRAGVVLTFDVIVEGRLPQGTPLEGAGLQVSVAARDLSSGLFSRGVVIDEEGISFSNATARDPGPLNCEDSTCQARLHGFLAGVPGDALEYSIRTTYAPDGAGSSPPGFRIELVQAREMPVRALSYQVPVTEGPGLVAVVVLLNAEKAVGDPPLGWFGVQYAEVWQSSRESPAFGCLADRCERATEVLFANDVGGAPSGPIRVSGWLAAETDPTLTIIDETRRAGAVAAMASEVLDEYKVTIDHPSRDVGLPLLVDLRWAGEEFNQFFIDDTYAASPLNATALLAENCRGTSCSFVVRRTSNPGLAQTPGELIVTVVPWESATDPEISVLISD